MTDSPGEPAQRTDSIEETLATLGGGGFEDATLERGDLVGRYLVLEEVGRGAMGLVLAAYDPELDRKIALKLLHIGPGGVASTGSVRLLREAQAMARLSHPNVITVHDVGTAGEDLFIAMEFIEGGSLREWLRDQTRGWAEIVSMFIAAGEGLAAAHRQGIVHRDFKPDNVLVRLDGRACVGDFGLARRDETLPEPLALEDLRSTLTRPSPRGALGGLTMTGATMGTPAYMAPEQHRRDVADHRCDQFAFCVALWEALVGERPFAGTTLGTIALNVTTGQREPFPRELDVPSTVRAALERGLALDPEARFATTDELLDELRKSLRAQTGRPRDRVLAFTLVGLVAAGSLAAGLTHILADEPDDSASAPALCSRAEQQLAGIWDPALRGEVEAGFARAERAYVRDSFTRVAASLDRSRAAWIESHTQACEATRIYGEQSEDLLDRRMTCLAQRRSELAAVSDALARAGPEAIAGADKLLTTIAPISSCDDLELLAAGLAAPPYRQRARVEALRERLAKLEVMRRSGDVGEATRLSAQLVEDAEALAYDPLLAEALYLHAALLEGRAGPGEALPVARRAVTVAAKAGHRFEQTRALMLVAWLEGTGRANFEIGHWLLDQAEAELEALGQPSLLSLQVMSDRAAISTVQGEYEAGLRQFELALEFAIDELGPDHVRVADLRFNIAATQHYLGHHEQAERTFRASLTHYTKLMGPDHPEVAQCHGNLASTLIAQGQLDEAERHSKRAIEIWTANGGTSYLPGAYADLGQIALAREQEQLALSMFAKAHAMKVEVFGPDHPVTLGGLAALADANMHFGQLDEAEVQFEDALARMSTSVSPDHPEALAMHLGLAELAQRRADPALALARLDRLEALAGEAGADGRPFMLSALVLRAELELERGRPAPALSALDRADELFASSAEPVAELRERATQLRERATGP